MRRVGIEAIDFYGGSACIHVNQIFQLRGLNLDRIDNLMMYKKSVDLPCEDPVTHAVNAAKPIIDRLSPEERSRIELLITASESGIDFGKSLSTYIHDYLGLSRNCRLFEVKQACYGGTAGLHMAACMVAAQVSPGAKALVIATDVARSAARINYAEPSQGVGAVAMLVGENPDILELDLGANGFYSYEVMDTCRPLPDMETGDPDVSLLSYLDCLENSYRSYAERVEGVDFQHSFDYLAFHTPFPGMVKGAHRKMMRDLAKASPGQIDADFQTRLAPSISYCAQVGNVYSATLYLALCSLIDQAPIQGEKRVGLFSYGSGCSSEFYSGTITARSKQLLSQMRIGERLDQRFELNVDEYERILDLNAQWQCGVRDKTVDIEPVYPIYRQALEGKGYLVLKRANGFHREYGWS